MHCVKGSRLHGRVLGTQLTVQSLSCPAIILQVLRDPVTKAVTGLKVEVTALQEQPGKPAVAVGTGGLRFPVATWLRCRSEFFTTFYWIKVSNKEPRK